MVYSVMLQICTLIQHFVGFTVLIQIINDGVTLCQGDYLNFVLHFIFLMGQ